MRVNIDLNKIATVLATACIMAVVAAIWDVQNLKASVSRQDDKIETIYDDVKIMKAHMLGLPKEK